LSPLDKGIIRRKLGVIMDSLRILDPIGKLTFEEYMNDLLRRKATERLMQELIEAAIDINAHILSETGHQAPDDYYDSFIRLGTTGVIPTELAQGLAPSAGLRNRIVHDYDALDDAVVHKAILVAEELYPLYIREIERYISKIQ
jgi:uncharacterized protein YutE (UPF0331/DUF86 family)